MKHSPKQPTWVIYLSLSIALAALLLSGLLLIKDENTLVYIDAVKLISKYKGLETARKSLQSKRQSFKLRLDTLENEFKIVVDEYNDKKGKVSKRELLVKKF